MILSLTFKDQTTRGEIVLYKVGYTPLAWGNRATLGLVILDKLHMDKEDQTNRFIVQDLVEGHFTFINTYQCWKATSGLSLIKHNIDGTALARNTYLFSLRWGYLRVVNICLWTYLGIWRRKLAKGKLWIPCLCVFSCKARSMCMVYLTWNFTF